MAQTLLQKALAKGRGRSAGITASKDEAQLAIAYIEGRITLYQYAGATKRKHPGAVQQRICSVLRSAHKQGFIAISRT
jgi:hypothetical protein